MEDDPVYIEEDGFLLSDEDEVMVTEVNFTKYIPGARWLYWKYREENLKVFRYLFIFLFFAEIFCVALQITQNRFEFFYLSSLLGFSVFYFMFSKLLICQKFLIDSLSIKIHFLSLAVIFAVFIRIEVLGNLALLLVSSIFVINDSELKFVNYLTVITYNMFCFRVSILFGSSLLMVLSFFVEFFSLRREAILVVIESVIFITQSVHVSITYSALLSYLYIKCPQDFFIEKSLVIALLTTFILVFFKFISR